MLVLSMHVPKAVDSGESPESCNDVPHPNACEFKACLNWTLQGLRMLRNGVIVSLEVVINQNQCRSLSLFYCTVQHHCTLPLPEMCNEFSTSAGGKRTFLFTSGLSLWAPTITVPPQPLTRLRAAGRTGLRL